MDPKDQTWPWDALRAARAAAGLPPGGSRLLRGGHCAVIALDDAGLIARVGRPGHDAARLDAEMAFGRHASAAGVPALAPADHVSDRAIATAHGAVAFWPLLRAVSTTYDWGWLAGALKCLHALPIPADLVSLWDPVGRIEARLDAYARDPEARDDYVAVLRSASAQARRDLFASVASLGAGLVHGDPLNVIVTADGPVLIDFDLAGLGPAAWDLASVAVSGRRFGRRAEDLRRFGAVYGADVLGWPAGDPLLRARELLDCSFALSLVGSDPAAAGQLDVRLRAWLDPGDASRWAPLPSV